MKKMNQLKEFSLTNKKGYGFLLKKENQINRLMKMCYLQIKKIFLEKIGTKFNFN